MDLSYLYVLSVTDYCKMSFQGYSDAMVNVGGGFLGVLVDMSGSGGKAYVENVFGLLPIVFIFIILSSVGAMFGFISYSTAIFYTFVILISLTLLQRLSKTRLKQKNP